MTKLKVMFIVSLLCFATNRATDLDFVCPFNYYLDRNASSCRSCPPGATKDEDVCYCDDENEYFDLNSWSCKSCPENSEPDLIECYCESEDEELEFNPGTGKCEKSFLSCKEGYFFNELRLECNKCPKGSTSDYLGTSCVCNDDKFFDIFSLSCKSCPADAHVLSDEDSCECNDMNKEYRFEFNQCLTEDEYDEKVEKMCSGKFPYFGYHLSCANCPGKVENGECICPENKYLFNYYELSCETLPENAKKAKTVEELECKEGYHLDYLGWQCKQCPEHSSYITYSSEDDDGECECEEGYSLGIDQCVSLCNNDKIISYTCKPCPKGCFSDGNEACYCAGEKPKVFIFGEYYEFFTSKKVEKPNIDVSDSEGSSNIRISFLLFALIILL